MGSVTIFLGGSGKYVASEMKLAREVWAQNNGGRNQNAPAGGPAAGPPWLVLDFDPRPEPEHAGRASVAGIALLPAQPFYGKVATDPKSVLEEWQNLNLTDGLMPNPDRLSPAGAVAPLSSSIRRRIGRQGQEHRPVGEGGLWGLRATGIAAIETVLFRAYGQNGEDADYLQAFMQKLTDAVQAAGPSPRIFLVTSVAGGTGAGLFLPLAMWLKEQPNYRAIPIHLIGVLPSAFDYEVPEGRNKIELTTKARAGAFAIIRELEYLLYSEPAAQAPLRRLLDGINYRPGESPIDKVIWIGRRPEDITGKSAIYRELTTCLQVLTNDQAWNAINVAGNAALSQERVLSAVVGGYPKPRVVSQLTSEVVAKVFGGTLLTQKAVDAVVEAAPRGTLPNGFIPKFEGRNLSNYGSVKTLAGQFLQDEEEPLILCPAATPLDSRLIKTASVDALLEGLNTHDALAGNLKSLPDTSELAHKSTWHDCLPKNGITQAEWEALVDDRARQLDKHFAGLSQQVAVEVRRWMKDEEEAFEKWLVDGVEHAFGEPAQPMDVVEAWLDRLEVQRKQLKTWFTAADQSGPQFSLLGINPLPFKEGPVSDFGRGSRSGVAVEEEPQHTEALNLKGYRYEGLATDGIQAEFTKASTGIADELKRRPKPKGPSRTLLLLTGAAGAVLAALLSRLPFFPTNASLLLTVGAGFVAGSVIGQVIRLYKINSANDRADHLLYLDGLLVDLTRERFLAQAWPTVQKEFATTLCSKMELSIQQLKATLSSLRAFYLEVAKTATTAAEGTKKAKHEVVSIEPPEGETPSAGVHLLHSHLRITHEANGGWTISLYPLSGDQLPTKITLEIATSVVQAAQAPAGEAGHAQTPEQKSYMTFLDKVSDEALDGLSTGTAFPRTLAQAVAQGWTNAPTITELVATLSTADSAEGKTSSRAFGGQTLTPGPIVAFGNAALASQAAAIVANLPQAQAIQVADLGESIAVVRPYQPGTNTFGNLAELRSSDGGIYFSAERAYYFDYGEGEAPTVGLEGETRRKWSELNAEFHILPELAASVAIESHLNRKTPLSLAVSRRLFGSDIGNDIHHPTLVGMFYLLRASGHLTQIPAKTPSNDDCLEFRLLIPDRDPLRLVSVSVNTPDAAPFGPGQAWLDCLERLELLISHPGVNTTASLAHWLPTAHGEVDIANTWKGWDALSKDDFKRTQEWIVRFWNSERRAQKVAMRATLKADQDLMSDLIAGVDWVQAVDVILGYHETHQ